MLRIWARALWLIPLFLLLDSVLRPVAEPDIFFYFAVIEKYLSTGHWPLTDPFVYSVPTDALMTLHQWLGYWVFYLPFRLLGWAGPIGVTLLVVSALLTLPLLPWWRERRALPFYFPFLWTLEIFVAHHRFRERVSVFGDLFTVLLVGGLLWCKDRRWFWWSLPGLFLLWAQMHPSYPLGWAILIGYFALSGRLSWQRLPLCSTLLCILAPLCNPLGWEGVSYPFHFALTTQPYLSRYVVEWLPLWDERLFQFHFLYVPLFTVVPFLLWRMWSTRFDRTLFELFLLGMAIALNLNSVRFGLLAQGLYLLLVSCIELRLKPAAARSWIALLLTTALAVAVVVTKQNLSPSPGWGRERFTIDTSYFPVRAVDELERLHPQMHIFNSFGFGGYLAWRWGGNPPIFFHGFSTNFPFYESNYNFAQESQAHLQAIVDKFDLGVFLISRLGNDNNFIELLDRNPGWQKIYDDGIAVIFARRDPRVFQAH
jgi:hypothetical protein